MTKQTTDFGYRKVPATEKAGLVKGVTGFAMPMILISGMGSPATVQRLGPTFSTSIHP